MNTQPPTESDVQEMMAALAVIAQEYTEEERRRAAERVLGDMEWAAPRSTMCTSIDLG